MGELEHSHTRSRTAHGLKRHHFSKKSRPVARRAWITAENSKIYSQITRVPNIPRILGIVRMRDFEAHYQNTGVFQRAIPHHSQFQELLEFMAPFWYWFWNWRRMPEFWQNSVQDAII